MGKSEKTETEYMDELRELFRQMLDQDLIQIVLSNTRDAAKAAKVKVRPVLIRGELYFQETLYRENKVFHSNHTKAEMQERQIGRAHV